MRACAIIPVFNEAGTVEGVVARVRPHVAEVVVVDDGSSDGTADLATRAGARCLRLEQNRGKGCALRHALADIAHLDYTHVLFLDGDGQHSPSDIPALLDQASATGADLVIGARTFDSERMPASRHFSNTVGSRLASLLVGQPIRDSQSGFRLVKLDSLRRIRLRARRYEFEMEVLIKVCANGGRVTHAPVALVYDGGRARSKMHPIRDTVRICLWSLAFRYLGF